MNGFLNLFKPIGMKSFSACKKASRKLGIMKAGHLGTLDPEAEGVLPIALGKATKFFDYFLKKDKTYIAEFTFGYETDTLDRAGKVVAQSQLLPTKDEILKILPNFIGLINQIPPQFSAKSVNGERAYDLARKGQFVELKAKEVNIYDYELLKQSGDNTFEFKISCSSGTYIRSLCKDLAEALNTKATMTKLLRIKCGNFKLEDSKTLEEIDLNDIIPIDKAISLTRVDIIEKEKYFALKNGCFVSVTGVEEDEFFVYYKNELIGLGYKFNNLIKLKIHL